MICADASEKTHGEGVADEHPRGRLKKVEAGNVAIKKWKDGRVAAERKFDGDDEEREKKNDVAEMSFFVAARGDERVDCKHERHDAEIDRVFPISGVAPIAAVGRMTEEVGREGGEQTPTPQRVGHHKIVIGG